MVAKMMGDGERTVEYVGTAAWFQAAEEME